MPYSLELPCGTDGKFLITLMDAQGTPVTSLTTADTPTAEVWIGGDQPVLWSPLVTWIDPTQGTISLAISGTDTTARSPGRYRIRVLVDTANGRIAVPDAYLVLAASPTTTSTVYTSYCTYEDMRDYFPSIKDIQDDGDDEGFARQRWKARTWLERVIQRNRGNSTGYTSLGPGGPTIYGYWSGWYMTGQDDPVLQGYLDQDLLIVRSIVTEMTAKKALSYVSDAQIGPEAKESNWQMLGQKFGCEAEGLALKYNAEIDIDGDGYSDLTIPCGRTSMR